MRSGILIFLLLTSIFNVYTSDEKPIYSENLGRFQVRAKSGVMPDRYYPLDEQDEMDSRSMAEYIVGVVKTLQPLEVLNFNLTNFNSNINIRDHFDLHALRNIVISGLNYIETYNVELRKNDRLDWSVYVPEVVMQADLYLRTALGQFNGHLRITVSGVAGHLAFGGRVLGISSDLETQRFQIDSADVAMDIGHFHMSVTTLEGFSAHSMNGNAGGMLAQFVNNAEPLASTLLREVIPYANVALNTVPVSDVFKSYQLEPLDYEIVRAESDFGLL